MLAFADLSQETLSKLKRLRFDKIDGKHEGPWTWKGLIRFNEPEFITVADDIVLLPLDRLHLSNITILRSVKSADESMLMLFLKDTTYVDKPEDEIHSAGYLAICELLEGEDFFVTNVYHEWYILDEFGPVEA